MCHNPHTQTRKVDARTACSTAGCHGDWRKVPFHVGAAHGRRAEQCTTCHQPHAARVDASDCVGCHNSVRARSNGVLKPPLPFDTLKALRRSDPSRGALAPFPSGLILGVGGPFELGPSQPDERPGWAGAARPDLPNVPSDTFPHSRHRQLACLTCHLGRTGAKLTFVPPRGCQICHHQSGDPGDCASCHRPAALAPAVAVELAIAPAGRSSRLRSVTFSHDKHAKLRCTGCHSESVTRRPADSVTSCRGCHEQHHAPERDCSACHRTSTILVSHARPVRAHVGCNACHATPAIAGLSPTRSFCLTCHGANVDHHRDEECSTCHFQASPTEYRPRLLRPAKVE